MLNGGKLFFLKYLYMRKKGVSLMGVFIRFEKLRF